MCLESRYCEKIFPENFMVKKMINPFIIKNKKVEK